MHIWNSSVSNNQPQTATKRCAKMFAGVGVGAALANVAINDGLDCFQKAGKEAVEHGLKFSTGVLVKAGTIGVLALGVAAVAATVGAIIGKCIDKVKQGNKQAKNPTATLQKTKPISETNLLKSSLAAPKGCVARTSEISNRGCVA